MFARGPEAQTGGSCDPPFLTYGKCKCKVIIGIRAMKRGNLLLLLIAPHSGVWGILMFKLETSEKRAGYPREVHYEVQGLFKTLREDLTAHERLMALRLLIEEASALLEEKEEEEREAESLQREWEAAREARLEKEWADAQRLRTHG